MNVERLPSGSFLGSRSAIVEVGGFKAGLWRASVPPEGVHLHVHDDAHFVLALDEGYRSLAHDAHSPRGAAFRQGALVWNPPGVEHRDSFEQPGGRFLSVSFMPPATVRQGEPLRLHRGPALATARAVVGAVATFREGDALRLEGLLLDLAGSAIDSSELDEDPAPDWVLRAHQMILDNARVAGLEIREIARSCGVHPVSLARRYRRHFGVSPAFALRQTRVAGAAAAIERGVDLAETADGCGFADQSHLTRDFRSVFGVSPAGYRRLLG